MTLQASGGPMRTLLALLLLVPASAPSIALEAHPLSGAQAPGPRWVVDAHEPDPVLAGQTADIDLIVHREVDGQRLAGPGQANVTLDADPAARCTPHQQTVRLDPSTGQGRAQVHCEPTRPGRFPIEIEARSTASRPGNWTSPLTVDPDRLEGTLTLGEPDDHRFPVKLLLAPTHLDQAPVDVSLEAHLVDTALGFREPSIQTDADGSWIERELVALHGPGEYRVHATANGPLTQTWTAAANVTVPEPPDGDTLDLDAVIEASNASLSLANDPINDDEKHKNPGQELTTRFQAEGTDYVNVTVYRIAANGTEVELAQQFVPPDETGEAEHVFAQDPLPAGTLWVRGQAGNQTVQRNASIQDLNPSASVEGPDLALRDADAWEANLTLEDRNFGSTSSDPGPLYGLPDVDWTVFKGRRSGSSEAEGFTVEVGAHLGASNGTGPTSSITWPEGPTGVEVSGGKARIPVRVHAPPDAEVRGYRLSLYENETGDLLATQPFSLQDVDVDALEDPRPGRAWPIEVGIEDPSLDASVEVALLRDGEEIANRSFEEAGAWRPVLPSPLPAGTQLAVKAHVAGSGGSPLGLPHEAIEATVPELGPDVRLHPILDGVPTQAPVALHPAHAHELELAYHAFDPNEGPLNVTDVYIQGPDGSMDWPIEQAGEATVRIDVPEGPPPGRYTVKIELEERDEPLGALPLDVGDIVRVAVDGPEQVTLQQGGDRTLNLEVTNRGSLPVQEVTALVDTQLDLAARISNATASVPAGQPLGLALVPGETRELTVELQARGEPGSDQVSITVAGVAG